MNCTKPKEGLTKFTKFRNATYKIIPSKGRRGNTFKSMCFIIGTHLTGDVDEIQKQIRVLKHRLKQFVSEHSKDGYYKKDFILTCDIPNNIFITGSGYCGFEFFVFLEEPSDKEFIAEYFETYFKVIDDTILETNNFFEFRKVGSHKKVIYD